VILTSLGLPRGAGGKPLHSHVSEISGRLDRYEHLPIYKKTMDLRICFEKIVRNFSDYRE
jgi:hypothetical protein